MCNAIIFEYTCIIESILSTYKIPTHSDTYSTSSQYPDTVPWPT